MYTHLTTKYYKNEAKIDWTERVEKLHYYIGKLSTYLLIIDTSSKIICKDIVDLNSPIN